MAEEIPEGSRHRSVLPDRRHISRVIRACAPAPLSPRGVDLLGWQPCSRTYSLLVGVDSAPLTTLYRQNISSSARRHKFSKFIPPALVTNNSVCSQSHWLLCFRPYIQSEIGIKTIIPNKQLFFIHISSFLTYAWDTRFSRIWVTWEYSRLSLSSLQINLGK